MIEQKDTDELIAAIENDLTDKWHIHAANERRALAAQRQQVEAPPDCFDWAPLLWALPLWALCGGVAFGLLWLVLR